MLTALPLATLLLRDDPVTRWLKANFPAISYFANLERNSHIIYPSIAIFVVVLILGGILQAWRTQDLDVNLKNELKREVILMLRKNPGGVHADHIARTMQIDPLKIVSILEEMQKEGILLSHTNTSRLTMWRLKGVGGRRA